MSYQETTGTLSPGAHAGSYNGQDAYNDLLVVEDVFQLSSDRTVQAIDGSISSQDERLQGCNGFDSRGGEDMDEPIMMSDRKGHNGITQDGTATTLTAQEKERPIVASVDCRNATENTEVNGTLQSKEQGYNTNSNNVCRQKSTVRRLTPLETERLQGLPDNWTYLGDWVDSNGKKHKEADSPRYKAVGNGIALPFWAWLLERISVELDGDDRTLGSLFDGVGSFPLIWERINGKGTARWGSEIEEFPMAVSKRHLGDEDASIEGDIENYL